MKILKKPLFIYAITIPLGALAGYLYYQHVGCSSGTCPITSRPLPATLYGTVFGFLIGGLFIPKRKK